jgi:hypothetical protein
MNGSRLKSFSYILHIFVEINSNREWLSVETKKILEMVLSHDKILKLYIVISMYPGIQLACN